MPVGASAKTYTMKVGHQLPPKTALHVWSEKVKAGLERKAPGRFDVKIFPTSQLGTIEAIAVPPAFMTGVDRRYGVVTAPGIFDDIAHGQRTVHDPEFKKVVCPDVFRAFTSLRPHPAPPASGRGESMEERARELPLPRGVRAGVRAETVSCEIEGRPYAQAIA